MKKLLFLFTFGIFALNSCRQEENALALKEELRFTLDITNTGTADDLSATDLPDEIIAELTLRSSSGEVNISTEVIRFTKNGTDYISDPFPLKNGNYTITDFVVRGEQLETIPGLQNSFVVSQGGAKVIPIGSAAARKSSRPMHISVYIEQNGKRILTEATAYISGEGEYYEYDLAAKKNNIAFRGNPATSYSIEIRKEGYEPYTNTFVYNQLDKKRLEVTLQERVTEPGLAVNFQPSATYFSMWLEFTGKGSVTLDWGKGESEVIDFDVDPENATSTAYRFRDQAYALSIPPAKITGDIHLLVGIYFEADVDALDTEHATGLTELSFTEVDMPELNLATNSELTTLTFNNATFGEIVLPQQHAIRHLWIAPSPFWPNAEQLDYIISNIYVNTIAGNFNDGDVTLNGAPVSQQSATMLEDLQNSYSWTISY
jgi:hypothetical protein